MRHRLGLITIIVISGICMVTIVDTSYGERPARTIQQMEREKVAPPKILEGAVDSVNNSSLDSLSRSSGTKAEGVLEEPNKNLKQRIAKDRGSIFEETKAKNPPKIERKREQEPKK